MKREFSTLLLSIAMASPVLSQGETINRRIHPATVPENRTPGINDARQTMSDFAACTVRRKRDRVERYLETAPGSQAAADMLKRIATSDCLIGGQLSFDEPLYRAVTYEILYQMVFAQDAPVDLSAVAPLDYKHSEDRITAEEAAAQGILLKLADCAVRRGPVEAQALIRSPIGSASEKVAFESLKPQLAACMTNDITLKFSRSRLRGFIGETLYRLSVAARGERKAN